MFESNFRQLYKAVGFGTVVSITRLPVLSHLMELGYRIFAKNRLRLTGRCNSDTCGQL
ncbi:MAG: DCC1-like thiol-disulfide oxidoreductase family protein [Rubripirellula sp.]